MMEIVLPSTPDVAGAGVGLVSVDILSWFVAIKLRKNLIQNLRTTNISSLSL